MQQYFLSYTSGSEKQTSSMLVLDQNQTIISEFGKVEELLNDEIIISSSNHPKHILSDSLSKALTKSLQNNFQDCIFKPNKKISYTLQVSQDINAGTLALILNKTIEQPKENNTSEHLSINNIKAKKRPLFVPLQWVIKPDNSYDVIHCDTNAIDFLGLSLEDATLYFNNLKDHFYEEDKSAFIQYLLESITQISNILFEGRIRLPNKQIIWIQCCFSPKKLEDNSIYYSGIIFDITDKKETENNLLNSNARLKTLMANFTSGVILTNDKSEPIFVNPEFLSLFGFTPTLDDFLNNSPSLLLKSAENIKGSRLFFAKIKKISLLKKPSMNHRFELVDGRFIEFDYVPVTENNQWLGHLWIFRDISQYISHEKELLKAKEEAENSEKTKSAFLASMSHELRTPLNGILGCSDAILDITDEASVKRLAQIIEMSGRRLLDSLNSILDLSALQAGKISTIKTIFNLNELIEDQINLFQERAHQQKLSLTFTDDCASYIYSDKKLLNKVLDNLTNNAIKFTRKGGISIHLSNELINNNLWAKIQVSDTGIGIKADNLNIIFEPFRQVSEGYRREFDGTGLGLNLTKQYLDLLGGKISVTSKFGEGTSFTLLIPGVQPNAFKQVEQTENVIINKKSFLNKKAFIVEDDATNMSVIQFQLENYVQADYASNGTEAIEQLSKNKYDIVLLDIHLGKKETGIDILNFMRNNKLHTNTPAIALTAHAMPDDQEKLLSAGFNAYLSKPYTKNTLYDLIAKYLVY